MDCVDICITKWWDKSIRFQVDFVFETFYSANLTALLSNKFALKNWLRNIKNLCLLIFSINW